MKRTHLVALWLLSLPQFSFGLPDTASVCQQTNHELETDFENVVNMLVRVQQLSADFEALIAQTPTFEDRKLTNVENAITGVRQSIAEAKILLRNAIRQRTLFEIRHAPEHLRDPESKKLLEECSSEDLEVDTNWKSVRSEFDNLYASFSTLRVVNANLRRGDRFKKKALRKMNKKIYAIASLGQIQVGMP